MAIFDNCCKLGVKQNIFRNTKFPLSLFHKLILNNLVNVIDD